MFTTSGRWGSINFVYSSTRVLPHAREITNPTRAVRLRNGNTLISDQFNHQVIQVDHEGKIVFEQGKIAVSGDGFDRLNGPYDAKVNGDYTGLTPPF